VGHGERAGVTLPRRKLVDHALRAAQRRRACDGTRRARLPLFDEGRADVPAQRDHTSCDVLVLNLSHTHARGLRLVLQDLLRQACQLGGQVLAPQDQPRGHERWPQQRLVHGRCGGPAGVQRLLERSAHRWHHGRGAMALE